MPGDDPDLEYYYELKRAIARLPDFSGPIIPTQQKHDEPPP